MGYLPTTIGDFRPMLRFIMNRPRLPSWIWHLAQASYVF
jgi:hypothetical protein